MSSINGAPMPMQNWLASLPSQNCGTLYATIRHPMGWKREYKVPVWGQVCDGRDHMSAVKCFLHNEFPFKGKGYTYISWRAEPDNPEQNTYPRTGLVENPTPFSGNPRE